MKEELRTTLGNIEGKSRSLFCPGSLTDHLKQLNMFTRNVLNDIQNNIIVNNSRPKHENCILNTSLIKNGCVV